jgi:hypothetical protein
MTSQYYTFTTPIEAGKTTTFTFLGNAGQKCTEAWILAQSSGGSLKVRLTDGTNNALSETTTIWSSTLERTKLLNINVIATPFPETITLTVDNEGNAGARVKGVLLVWETVQ